MKRLFIFPMMLLLLSACDNAPDRSTAEPSTQPEQSLPAPTPAPTPAPEQKPAPPAQIQIDTSMLPKTPKTFDTAKRKLYQKVYKGRHEKTFYCGCSFNPDDLTIDLASCGVSARKNAKRAVRVEAEHVNPAYWFGNYRRCWREPELVCPKADGKKVTGRKCCEKVDPVFRTAHNDLHNLYPVDGEINGDRSNYPWGMIAGEKREYGQCNIEVDSQIRRAEPPEDVMGNIARTMFYMSDTYGLNLSDQNIKLFNAWHKQDPVDAWELERNGLIAELQGNRNPFIDGKTYDPRKIAKFPDVTDANLIETTVSDDEQPRVSIDWSKFSCDTKKTCSQMTTCEQAIYHQLACDNKTLDRDGDGVPCKALCGERPPVTCEPDKKYCTHMADCNEAKFYLNVCGIYRLDGDGDGIPCSSLCN